MRRSPHSAAATGPKATVRHSPRSTVAPGFTESTWTMGGCGDAFVIAKVPLSDVWELVAVRMRVPLVPAADRKSTRLNSSHLVISYAVFCLKKKKKRCVARQADEEWPIPSADKSHLTPLLGVKTWPVDELPRIPRLRMCSTYAARLGRLSRT